MLKLMTYKTQLLQINRALVEDPTNSGLLRLKKSLEKMVSDEIETSNTETLDYMLQPLTSSSTEAFEEHASTSGMSGSPLNYTNSAAESIKNNHTINDAIENTGFTKKIKSEIRNFKKQEFDLSQPSVSKEHNNENNRDDFEIPLEESLKAVEEFIAREKELSKWRIGENCLALWKGNGNYYMARIEAISPSGQVDIVYDTYDVKDEIYYQHMHKFTGKKCGLTDKAHMKKSAKHNMQRSARQEPQILKKGLAFHSNSIPVCKRNERLRQQHLVATVVQNH